MIDILKKIHSDSFIEETLGVIKKNLAELYGEKKGRKNYNCIIEAGEKFLRSLSDKDIGQFASFDRTQPYNHLKGKIFAISYPDNVYIDEEPTLQTLKRVLGTYFPGINGIHILPERVMSHYDVWPQDFFEFLSRRDAVSLVEYLQKEEYLDEKRIPTEKYGAIRDRAGAAQLASELIIPWLEGIETGDDTAGREKRADALVSVIEGAYNSHFNDGGFSQKTRAKIDPRFGTLNDLKEITSGYSVMLDYVVNHLDIDNDYLEAFRRGQNSGDAFILITPKEYDDMQRNGELSKTFRPRPFPLFTGVRKYPLNKDLTLSGKAEQINAVFTDSGLKPIDERVILFFSIYFKVQNDQGLTAEDKRVLDRFKKYLKEQGIEEGSIFTVSARQPAGQMFRAETAEDLSALVSILGFEREYGEIFLQHDDEIFGEKFFVYTTFSESQVDINPLSESGFKMIIDDLFHLLSSGNLAMMRMDAIKYLWKEKGRRNFDMEEGNILIDVIRGVMQLFAPGVLPLDEVNSPDPVVYKMEKDGGFAYLFGQVNSVVTAFNEQNLEPLKRFYTLFKEKQPRNFVPFIMLSTHDGRSVQGLGVQRTDGHVSIEQFYRLKEVIEDQGGKAKYRSVPRGQVAMDTFEKVITEAGLNAFKEKFLTLFTSQSVSEGDVLILTDPDTERQELLEKMAAFSGMSIQDLSRIPALDYFLDWIIDGKTIYELCATSRSSFRKHVRNGAPSRGMLTPEMEARRFAQAQAFVLTFGQAVPAIYFNDLLGLENDYEGYDISGKPRDLNRHKSNLYSFDFENNQDPFIREYIPLINKILLIRGKDPSFYPGSDDFEFEALNESIFLNHPFHGGKHSFILGNISRMEQEIRINPAALAGAPRISRLRDLLSGAIVTPESDGTFILHFGPFGMLYLE